ncbi:MAG: helix-turn-helix transcriptional regulator [Pseudonocardiales bacterium]|nr:helix-turn-helix transcriptional regulator [Pseudonocardiales bacterium]
MTEDMTIGQRVAFYRKRRGISQEILAGLTGRTADWLRKVEHNHISLDRLSVIRRLADALDVALGDLIGEPTLMDWPPESGQQTVPGLRVALLGHRQFLGPEAQLDEPVRLDELEREVANAWEGYQRSQYSWLTRWLPQLITSALAAAARYGLTTDDGLRAHRLLAVVYQLATGFLTKIGEADLALLSAIQGLRTAHASGNKLAIGSLYRSVAHALLSISEYEQALALTRAASEALQPGLGAASPEYLSMHGTLQLVGALAAARHGDRAEAMTFLAEAQRCAHRLGRDANYLWTAFGPTNVAIHRVAVAMELGDGQVAIDLGPRIDTTGLPTERRVRHAIETARAFARRNRVDSALDTLLDAERQAPDQIRYHKLSRILVRDILRRPRPPSRAIELATRMGVHRTGLADKP